MRKLGGRKKYEFSGWEKSYDKSSHPQGTILDSKSLPKRIILLSNIMISSDYIQKGEEHILLLRAVLNELKSYGIKG